MVPKKTAILLGLLVLGVLMGGGVGWAWPAEGPPAGQAEASAKLDPAIAELVAAAVSKGEEQKRATIKQMRAEAKRLRIRNQTPKARAIDQAADQLEGQVELALPKLYAPFQLGQVGHVAEELEVVSIVDKGNVIAMGFFDGDPQTVWIRGVATANLVNDGRFTLGADDVYHVSGVKEYQTALGSTNRVLVIEPIDLAPYLKAHEAKLAEASAELPAEGAEDLAEKTHRAAAAKLNLAKQFLDKGQTATGRRWLLDLVKDYPNTPAADEARKLLAELPN